MNYSSTFDHSTAPPERYAIHKLLIISERSGPFKAKVSKDLVMAASLLEYFAEADPDAIRAAWGDALGRGPGWRMRALEGRKALAAKAPGSVESLLD